jgi:type IV pilus assembly protein PilX
MESSPGMFNAHSQGFRAARGSALVIALLMLLILTVLGLASMQSTSLQERMAGNFDQRNQAFQLAELGLRTAEREFADARRRGTAQPLDEASDLLVDNWPAACPDLDQLACSGAGVSANLACVAAFGNQFWGNVPVATGGGRVRYTVIPLHLRAEPDRCVPPRGTSRQISVGGDYGTAEGNNPTPVRVFVAEGVAPDNTSMILIQAVFEGPRDETPT